METLTFNELRDVYKRLGYSFFDGGKPYNVNIFGIRTEDKTPNVFNDYVGIAFRTDDGLEQVRLWEATTDPGLYWLKNPGYPKGTAILVPDQYRSVYAIDEHRGQYLAVCQRLGPVRVFRDPDRDSELDMDPDTIDEGFFGINIHKAGKDSDWVNKWSAGCHVFKREGDFHGFMHIVDSSRRRFGNKFTYTLLTENQLNE